MKGNRYRSDMFKAEEIKCSKFINGIIITSGFVVVFVAINRRCSFRNAYYISACVLSTRERANALMTIIWCILSRNMSELMFEVYLW